MKKKIALLLAIALILGGTAGCAKKIEYVYVEPTCQVPPMPSGLPVVAVDDVYDALEEYHGEEKGRGIAEDLRERERRIVDSLMEHRAALKEVCE